MSDIAKKVVRENPKFVSSEDDCEGDIIGVANLVLDRMRDEAKALNLDQKLHHQRDEILARLKAYPASVVPNQSPKM